jgi:beta-N-acetylhexosaminidase
VPKACILGLGGTQLSARERAFFTETDPLGFILFDRNCRTPDQIRSLIASLREISGRTDAPILIDQEGGRVARLKPPHWRAAPPAAVFGRLHGADPDAAARAVWLNARLIGAELQGLGINVDCAPVLDLPETGADPIIGDRAFSTDAGIVAALGSAFRDGLSGSGVLAVIKHIPGHGRAGVDSHLQLPRVASPAAELAATDFAPFKALSGGPAPKPWAMTAHVVYEAIDPENPATLSASVIGDVIRGAIGFDGILISDDLSMEALSGPLAVRARKAVGAGCDLNLHCNGKMEEMHDVALESPELSKAMVAQLAQSLGALLEPEAFDPEAAVQELDALLVKAGITGR